MTEVIQDFDQVCENPTKFSELTNSHHIGILFGHKNVKAYFAYTGKKNTGLFGIKEAPKVRLISAKEVDGPVPNKGFDDCEYSSPQELFHQLRDDVKAQTKVFVFKTRKELYRWLSE